MFDLSFVKRLLSSQSSVKISGIGTKAIGLDFIGYESKSDNHEFSLVIVETLQVGTILFTQFSSKMMKFSPDSKIVEIQGRNV